MATASSSTRLDAARSRAVIEALGGTTATAEIFGIAPQNVSQWKSRGIPAVRLQFLQVRFKKVPAVSATLDFQPWTTARR